MSFIKIIRKYKTSDLMSYGYMRFIHNADLLFSTLIFIIKSRFFNITLGNSAKVWGPVSIIRFPGSRIIFGSQLKIISRASRYNLSIFAISKFRTLSETASITIGDNVGVNAICIMARSQEISIGHNTLIGGNCQIMDTDGHPLWPVSSRSYYPGAEHDAPVRIGKNVFIGVNVIILKGATIGDNSVIGAGSVVSGRIPENCVAAGAPARIIRYFETNNN
jgi:acetyltransferase-like isoleucine patch superfamily enzyme